MKSICVGLISLIACNFLIANVKSSTDLKFDANSDGVIEAVINNTGLTVSNNLVLGSSAQASELHLNGAFHQSFQSYSSNATLGVNAYALVDTSSDNVFVTLPYAGNVSGRLYTIKKVSDQNKVWVLGGGNQIDAHEPVELSEDYGSIKVLSDGEKWHVVDSSSVTKTVAGDNLVAYWHFDQSTGSNIYDFSSYDHTGVANNMSAANVSTPALVSNGMDFDGGNDYVEIENSEHLRGMAEITITSWVYIHSKQNYAAIVAKTDNNASNSNRTYRMQFDNSADQKFRFHFYTNLSDVSTVSNSAAPLNQWVFLVMLYNGSKTQIYVDSVLQSAEGTISGNVIDYSNVRNTVSIGHQQYNLNNNNAFDGLIDEVRIYNKALNEEEIRALHQQGL